MTAALRQAMDDVRRSVAVLAARVRDAHAARVWVPLGHSSWESYCDAEFGISRAQAYRLLDVARALAAIHGAIAAGTETSRTRDSGPAAATALDYGLSQRALIAVSFLAKTAPTPCWWSCTAALARPTQSSRPSPATGSGMSPWCATTCAAPERPCAAPAPTDKES
ncbi:hypothetical protein [Streptomyces cucumeris]|uniref:hypothetical protein n=1 Tax=Streptomyces cucumeris TaxID=2962890 RepID=UPI0020C88CD8|nr:hypothetical protein [Streptomyces sp. NEAU-Y11]MCP9213481.1 hypothetical protein [Streptomyces sp. NEAU-Y11]